MSSSQCPDCGHPWSLHPGASVWVSRCAECIYEEDTGARGTADLCSRIPPADQQPPVGGTLVARHVRRLLRGDRVSIEDRRGSRWALLRPPTATREAVERLLSQVREDLATMPVIPFAEKYRHLDR